MKAYVYTDNSSPAKKRSKRQTEHDFNNETGFVDDLLAPLL